jgi:PAS domain-containing protein
VHKLFAQQVAKTTDESGHLNLERLAELVVGAYEELDRDRRRTDHSMALMIEEIDAIHRELENTVIERTQELRIREAELEAQNRRFDAAVSNMSQGLVMFDAGARLVICNQRYTQMYGLKANSVRPGSTLHELIRSAQGERDLLG